MNCMLCNAKEDKPHESTCFTPLIEANALDATCRIFAQDLGLILMKHTMQDSYLCFLWVRGLNNEPHYYVAKDPSLTKVVSAMFYQMGKLLQKEGALTLIPYKEAKELTIGLGTHDI